MNTHTQSRFAWMLLAGFSATIFCSVILAFPIGAPGRLSGGPGEQDCTNCHLGQLADTPPQLTLDSLPDTVRAGSRQVFTITVAHPDMVVAGIQTVIRPGDDELHYVGQLQSDQLTTLMKDGFSYLNHTMPFRAVSGAVTLTIVWDVPDTTGIAMLNTAMVAANEDGTPFGDSVVKTERTIQIIAEDK
jgi:hypothetical protein